MRELVSVKKLNKLSELKVASLDLHVLYSQGVAKELVDAQQVVSEKFITFTKTCPCCSKDLNIHVFLYEKQILPLKKRLLPHEITRVPGEGYEDVSDVDQGQFSATSPNHDASSDLEQNERDLPHAEKQGRRQRVAGYPNDLVTRKSGQGAAAGRDEFICQICNKTLPDDEHVIYQHIYYHKNLQTFKCNLCQKRMVKKKRAVDDHVATHAANDGKPFICDLCGVSFRNRLGICHHLLNTHAPADKRPFTCIDCPGKKFSTKLSLEKHVKGCHFSLPCPHCSLVFKASNLRRHIDTIHAKKEFRCTECSVVCHAKDSLRSHIRRMHNSSTANKHKCAHCQKTFADESRLKRHLMVHDNERPFGCTMCKKRFREKHNLESHQRTHSGVKPFECQLCSRKFSDRGSYRNHIRMHEKALGQELDKSVKRFKLKKGDLHSNAAAE